MKRMVLILLLGLSSFGFAFAVPDLSRGMAAFEARQWSDAMDAFLEVLHQDPSNTQAHAYIVLITREMEAKREAIVREHRLQMLGAASQHLQKNQRNAEPLQQAIVDASQSEKTAEDQKWAARCEEARMERQAGHLLYANDLILQILAENDSNADAQRELSEIQSQIRQTLDSGTVESIVERYALEGFYAFGQADYGSALTAWGKVHAVVEQTYRRVLKPPIAWTIFILSLTRRSRRRMWMKTTVWLNFGRF